MKNIFIALILISCFCSCNKNETPKPDTSGNFIKFFGGAFDDQGFSVVSSGDGGFYIAGSTQVPNRPDTNIIVVKLNSNGNKVWEHIYNLGDEYDEIARDLVIGADGSLVVAGYKRSTAGESDFLLLQVNPNDPTDATSYLFGETSHNEKAFNIVLSPDDSYIVYGSKSSTSSVDLSADMFLVKTNLTDTVWHRQIGVTSKQDDIGRLKFSLSGGLIWCGTAHRITETDMRLVMADDFGNLMWDYGFDDNDDRNQYGYDINILTDGYLVAGSRNKVGSSNKEIYLVRTDENGDKTDAHTREIILSEYGSQEAMSLVQDENGNFIIAGYAVTDQGDKDVYIAKLSPDGVLIKSARFGGAGEDIGRKILKVSGGYIIIGTIYAGNNSMVGVYKINEELEIGK